MPLTLVPPRPGRTTRWHIRGTYLGEHVNRSAKTSSRSEARAEQRRIEAEIRRGRFSAQSGPTFLDALVGYLKAGGEPRFLGTWDAETGTGTGIAGALGPLPLADVDQATIDAIAVELLPDATPATRNRQIYTPISAVLKHAGIDARLRRPRGWRGSRRVTWLTPDQAFRLVAAADARDAEFGVFLEVMLYTGLRLSEALGLTCDRVEIREAWAHVPTTKNDDPRTAHLPPAAVAALARHPRGLDRGRARVFRFTKCGRLYTFMRDAAQAAGPDLDGVSFHVLRHTWATWMRRYGGLDTTGLVATGAWRDRTSAARYEHTVASEEARRADLLPVRPR